MSGSVLDANEMLTELCDRMESDEPIAAKTQAALEISISYLGVENSHLTRIEPETDYWEIIASTDPADGSFPVGRTTELQTTFCRQTVRRDDVIALHDVPDQGWENDIAYETHDLECYLGTPVSVGETSYGTLCFVAENSRDPFSEQELTFVKLLARLLGQELECHQHEVALTQGSQLVDVFSRIVRHNLRNDMTVIRGYVEHLINQLDEPRINQGTLTETIDGVISMAEKAREFEGVIRTEFQMQDVSIPALLQDVTTAVEAEYPETTVSLRIPENVTLYAMPTLETALHELLENAAKHAGNSPVCLVSVDATPERIVISISDDGPGLSNQEQRVLRDEDETQLVHGSGLGLWMVQWIVTSHDGTIDTTVTETGTTVVLSIPRPMTDSYSSH